MTATNTPNARFLTEPTAPGCDAWLEVSSISWFSDYQSRRADIRYMAGADCHYWPEVTEALIAALRADRNECVRLDEIEAVAEG